MHRLRTALCLALLLALVPLLALARNVLPQDNRDLVAKKYAGWSGVLRLWVFEGWDGGGSLAAWLNRCIERFERRHPGVYIQPQPVDAGAMAAFGASGIRPPDMLLFPPGLLETPEGLAPLSVGAAVRPSLVQSGSGRGMVRAVPVAMGAYVWVYDAGRLDGIPDTWRGSGASPAVPPDDRWHSTGAALLSLCAERRACAPSGSGSAERAADRMPEVDLGLSAGAQTPAPTATPGDAKALPCELPEAFAFDADAWRDFANGDAPALLASPRDLRRLQALSEQGRGPDWRCGGVAPFTDQLLYLAAVDRPDAEAQRALCEAFAAHLLGEECQGTLARAGAFSVTGVASGYAAGDPLAEVDAALGATALTAPNAFGGAWRRDAENIVREFIEGGADAGALWASLNAKFQENPNDS